MDPALASSSRIPLDGIQVDVESQGSAVAAILELARGTASERSLVVTPNLQHFGLVRTDPGLREIYGSASLSLADGWPIACAASLVRRHRVPRVTGSGLLIPLLEAASREGLGVAFVGGRGDSAKEAAVRALERFPDLQVRVIESAPKREIDDEELSRSLAGRLQASKAEILLVGLGFPRQERWLWAHRSDLGPGTALGIGAGLEFLAGTVRRAPRWLSILGLEWVFRLTLEPRRMGKRYARCIVVLPALVRAVRANRES